MSDPRTPDLRMSDSRMSDQHVPDPRIGAMHRRDILIAWAFIGALWLVLPFVAWATWDVAPSSGPRALLLIGGVVVLAFNTAAIAAMLAHYREDRDFIYGLDLRFLDAMKPAAPAPGPLKSGRV